MNLPCSDTGLNLTVVPVKFKPKTLVGCLTGAGWFVPESKN